MLVTVAIPCYQSENTIFKVVSEIKNEFKKHKNYDYQIVLVNDGSKDRTYCEIEKLCAADSNIVGLDLSRNFGQAAAKMAAIPYAKGEVMVYMDDDGQHPVNEIFRLIQKIEEGDDLVCAYFLKKEQSVFKKAASSLHSKFLSFCTKKPKDFHTSSYMAMSRFCIDALAGYHSPFAAMGGYLYHITNRVSNVEMVQKQRKEGKSGYSFHKLISLWISSVTSFSVVPLRMAAYVGGGFACLGILMGILIVLRKIMYPDTVLTGYTSLMAVLLVCSGILMLMLGLVGEYIGRTFMIMNDLPPYKIRDQRNAKALEETGQGGTDGNSGLSV